MNFDTFDPVDDHRAAIVFQKKYITSFTQNKNVLSFCGYMLWSVGILFPVFFLMDMVFLT